MGTAKRQNWTVQTQSLNGGCGSGWTGRFERLFICVDLRLFAVPTRSGLIVLLGRLAQTGGRRRAWGEDF
jgi:hypothetical protein